MCVWGGGSYQAYTDVRDDPWPQGQSLVLGEGHIVLRVYNQSYPRGFSQVTYVFILVYVESEGKTCKQIEMEESISKLLLCIHPGLY